MCLPVLSLLACRNGESSGRRPKRNTLPDDVEQTGVEAAPATEPAVEDNADAIFTWNYGKGERAKLDRLYEKAKTSQWNATTDLDWSIEVDPTKVIDLQAELQLDPSNAEDPTSPLYTWGDKEWEEFGVESVRWRLSQFLHGEQGALMAAAQRGPEEAECSR